MLGTPQLLPTPFSLSSPLQALFQVSSHQEEMEVTIQRLKAALDDQRQENTELISKVS